MRVVYCAGYLLLLLCLAAFAVPLLSHAMPPVSAPAALMADGMRPMADDELAQVNARDGGMFVADRILPDELAGAGTHTDYTFLRMGLDSQVALNMNLGKVQLGCGGINDSLTGTPGCDIDIDYLSLMGINAAGDRPSADGAASDFLMTRPYIELAVRNEGSRTQREVVGIKIGAERVNGALSFGRVYDTATANLERGGACDPGASTGAGVLNCNSGLNSISGFLSLEMSAGFKARAYIFPYTVDLDGCLGRLSPGFGQCDSATTPFFVEAGGTRLDVLHAAAAKLLVSDIDLGCAWWDAACFTAQGFADLIVDDGYGQLRINTRLLHFLTVPDTENFFMSFQREPVAWPNYSKGPPPADLLFDACNPAYGQVTARCSSGYAPVANTGWWLNAPGAKLLNILPPDRIDVGSVSWAEAISLFGPEGALIIDNPRLGLLPASNCYGPAMFC